MGYHAVVGLAFCVIGGLATPGYSWGTALWFKAVIGSNEPGSSLCPTLVRASGIEASYCVRSAG